MEICDLKINKKRKGYHRAIDFISIVIIVAIATDTFLSLGNIPNSVPTHFELDGILGGYVSNKFFIFTYSIISIVALIICNFFAHVTKKSKRVVELLEKEQKIKLIFMKVLALELVIIFSSMQFMVTRAVLNGNNSINGMISLILGSIAMITVCMFKFKIKKCS